MAGIERVEEVVGGGLMEGRVVGRDVVRPQLAGNIGREVDRCGSERGGRGGAVW